jgi:hypothetical protein
MTSRSGEANHSRLHPVHVPRESPQSDWRSGAPGLSDFIHNLGAKRCLLLFINVAFFKNSGEKGGSSEIGKREERGN